MTHQELRRRAFEEAIGIGPDPPDEDEHDLWVEKRHEIVVLLAALAQWDASLCRRAARETAGNPSPFVRDLLLEAADDGCGVATPM